MESTRESTVNSYVGLDVGKKTIECCRLSGNGRVHRLSTKTTETGLQKLVTWLKTNDLVALEAGNQAFRIAKFILSSIGCEVVVLNPGDIANIYNSLKKTDKEDALKLARLISRNPVEELPVVEIPSDEVEDARRLLSEQEYWSKCATACKNRLHSLFTAAGLTTISKKDLYSSKNRIMALKQLPPKFLPEANRFLHQLQSIEQNLNDTKAAIIEELRKRPAHAELCMSIPGVGPLTALSLYAYLGDCHLRFSNPKQIGFYCGLVPKVDISGDQVKYGRTINRGPKLLKRALNQAAWACVRSKYGGAISDFYKRLSERIGKKKAIVAASRKMVEIFYAMMNTGEMYRSFPNTELQKKMRLYKI